MMERSPRAPDSFFSLAFSSSSAFNRLASDTSRPPYLAFHLLKVALLIPYLRQTSAVFAPSFLLAQHPDDLLFREPARLHVHPPHRRWTLPILGGDRGAQLSEGAMPLLDRPEDQFAFP